MMCDKYIYYMDMGILLGTKTLAYATTSGTWVAYFPYVTFRSDITFPALFAVLQIASRFVNLSQDDIINFCDEQENENTAKKTT